MAIDRLSSTNLPIVNVPGVWPPEDTPSEQPTDPQNPNLTCTPDPTKTKTHREVIGLENAEWKAYGKATGLYNKHHNYWQHWNL